MSVKRERYLEAKLRNPLVFCEIPDPLSFQKILPGNIPDPLTISEKLAAHLRYLNLLQAVIYQKLPGGCLTSSQMQMIIHLDEESTALLENGKKP